MNDPLRSTEFEVFLPFGKIDKQDDGTILVHTRLNDETVDDQGEIVTYEAVEKASGAYMEWANVREMHHNDSAVGTMISLTPIPEERAHEAILHVVDPVAVQKVLTKVYRGSSMGGFKRRLVLSKVAGQMVRKVTEIDWRETSLADRPSRPSAILSLLKRSDLAEGELVIEDVTDEPLAKGSEAGSATDAPGPDPVTGVDTGPETIEVSATAPGEGTGGDVYIGADDPVEKVAESEPLAKSAADDADTLAYALSIVNRQADKEAEEGDTAGADSLRAIAASLVAAIGVESAEIGTAEDVAQAEADEPMPVVIVGDLTMAYASVTGDLARKAMDLRKVGARNSSSDLGMLNQIHDLSVAAGSDRHATAMPDLSAPAMPEMLRQSSDSEAISGGVLEALEPSITDATLAKVSGLIRDALGTLVTKGELEVMTGSLSEIRETLQKVASQPVNGGPLRYATDPTRFGQLIDPAGVGSTPEETLLAKVAQTFPMGSIEREALGKVAATAGIRQALERG